MNAGLLLLAGHVYGQVPNAEELAKRLVTNAGIQAGETVAITGDQEQFPMLENIAVEVLRKGGHPMVMVNSAKIAQAFSLEVPEEYLVLQHQALHKFKPDAAINLSSNIDYGAIEKKMPAEYVAKSRQARAEVHKTTGSTPWNRSVYLNLPTRQEAQQIHVDYDTYQQMQWAAINADYTAIAANAHQLEALLKTAKKGRLTAPNTKLTFNLNQGPVTINDGAISPEEARSAVEADRQISLPAGELTVLADENSANGKVLVPRDWCGYSVSEGKLTNASFAFVNGKVQHFKAEAGQACFDEYDKKDPGFSQFSGLAIGLNPALKVLSDDKQDYRPGAAEGMVFILIGGNARYGGQNKIQESFAFPIEKATLEIDGKTIIKDGKMVWTSLASK